MTEGTNTHIVVRSGFYRRVNGKLQSLEKGSALKLGKEQGERLTRRGFVAAIEKPGIDIPAPVPDTQSKPDDYPEDEAEPVKEKKKKKAPKKRKQKKEAL